MRINLVIPSFYPATIYGGPIFSTLHASKELAKLENVIVYVSSTNANMTTRLDVETDRWITFANNFYIKYYNETKVNKLSLGLLFNLWNDIKKADVVHVQSIFSTPTPIALFYAKLFKKSVLLSPRGQFGEWCLANGNRLKQTWLNLFVRPFVNNVLWHATAELEKSEILENFPDASIEIISNGIEFDLFQRPNSLSKKKFIKKFAEKEIDLDKIIVSMGRLQKKKGFDILIDSFVKVLDKHPISKLFIAGQDEGEKANLAEQINKLGLENKVFLIGPINGQDKIDLLANADLFVLPSHNENFGNVFVESLAAGTPIVASKNTPWEEVEEADCGKWVNNNVRDISNAILELLEKDRETMRINSKRLAKKYDWKNIAIQFKKVFEAMLNE